MWPNHSTRSGDGVEAAEVQVARAVAEPAAHLHQRVIHLRGAHEVADAQAFERQAARQLVAADGDDLEAVRQASA